jgi:hypothetical protein
VSAPVVARPPAHLRCTESKLDRWLARAVPGEALEYHRGHLAVDRTPIITELSDRDRRALDRVADAALAAAEQGRVHLVQRRHGPDGFSYLAIARPRPLARARLIPTMTQEAA